MSSNSISSEFDFDELKSQISNALDQVSAATPKELKQLTSLYNDKLSDFEPLQTLETQTGLPKLFWFFALSSFTIILTFLSFYITFLASFISNVIGVAYPAYSTIQFIAKQQASGDVLSQKNVRIGNVWITYWIIFSTLFVTEIILYKVLNYQNLNLSPEYQRNAAGKRMIFRFWFAGKTVVLCLCQFAGGSKLVYEFGLKPVAKLVRKGNEALRVWLQQFDDYEEVNNKNQTDGRQNSGDDFDSSDDEE